MSSSGSNGPGPDRVRTTLSLETEVDRLTAEIVEASKRENEVRSRRVTLEGRRNILRDELARRGL